MESATMVAATSQPDEPFISHDVDEEKIECTSNAKRTNSKRSTTSHSSSKSQDNKPPNVLVIMCVTVFLIAGSVGAGWLEWYLKFSFTRQGPKFTFPVFYADHMVIHQDVNGSIIWGHANEIDVDYPVSLYIEHVDGSFSREYTTTVQPGYENVGGLWRIELDPMDNPGPYNLNASLHHLRLQLHDFYFGDVWLCLGPQHTLGTNDTLDIAEVRYYRQIRLLTMTEDAGVTTDRWVKPHTDGIEDDGWSYTSAICWQYAKFLHQSLQRPLGLIVGQSQDMSVSNFSPPDTQEPCRNNVSNINYLRGKVSSLLSRKRSRGWDRLLKPLLGLNMQGVVWISDQIDRGVTEETTMLNCSFVRMVESWRRRFFNASYHTISGSFDFGFVQFGAGNESSIRRWQQTADYGVVPNPLQTDVFMAVTVDLIKSTTNPVDLLDGKLTEEIGRRLAVGSEGVTYSNESLLPQRPWPLYYRSPGLNGKVELKFPESGAGIEVRSRLGFELCCTREEKSICTSKDSKWFPASAYTVSNKTVSIVSSACRGLYLTGLRYLWADNPCRNKQCSVYSAGRNKLPLPQLVLTGFVHTDEYIKIQPKQYFPT